MEISNKYFGTVEYEEEEILYFREGIFGFEEQKEFLPIPFEEGSDTMLCLQSLREKGLCFILLNPFHYFPSYDPKLTEKEKESIGATAEEDISYYVIAVIRERIEDSTVNLKAPIAVNAGNRRACQVILEDPRYTFRHSLESGRDKEV